jgi:DNA invertase Pin-like site-specific DNA recombinase|tara:strand:- start:136 stop:729 length:594 start_codon:yes stop_codon:yes gene_type:complete
MNMRVVKYQRVSTQDQEVENQTDSIDRQIELLGWTTVGEYKEVMSGTKSRDTRPQLRKLLQDSRKRKFDRVIVYSMDRLGRSVVDVINTIHELEEVGVNIFVVKNSIDTSTSQGKLFSYFINIFSEMERDMIVSRQKESIKRIREKGGKWGRGNLISQEKREQIVQLKHNGMTYRNICKELSVSLGSVQHTLKTVSI